MPAPGPPETPPVQPGIGSQPGSYGPTGGQAEVPPQLKRFHGMVRIDPTRVSRDAGRIADEVVSHRAGLLGAEVTVTLEINATMPDGASDRAVRTVMENCRPLKFSVRV